jgi:hypothetical protein
MKQLPSGPVKQRRAQGATVLHSYVMRQPASLLWPIPGLLLLHLACEARRVDAEAPLRRHELRQVEGEAQRVVQVEGLRAHGGITRHRDQVSLQIQPQAGKPG